MTVIPVHVNLECYYPRGEALTFAELIIEYRKRYRGYSKLGKCRELKGIEMLWQNIYRQKFDPMSLDKLFYGITIEKITAKNGIDVQYMAYLKYSSVYIFFFPEKEYMYVEDVRTPYPRNLNDFIKYVKSPEFGNTSGLTTLYWHPNQLYNFPHKLPDYFKSGSENVTYKYIVSCPEIGEIATADQINALTKDAQQLRRRLTTGLGGNPFDN